jgi:zinc D-Ala-D-Ala carboxypeptidase
MNQKLTANFWLDEFTISQTATRMGIDNTPPPEIIARLKTVTAPGLEKVRAGPMRGNAISISSGYRCPRLNAAVGGSSSSAHLWGWATDFNCRRFGSPLAVCKAIAASDIEYDQLIHEFGRWVHISFDPRMRGQELTIDSLGSRSGFLPVRG